MNVETLVQVLTRRGIPRGQITLFKELYERDDEFVSSSELINRIRWGDEERFPGVLRAFGTRINATDGIVGKPGIEAFLERERIDGDLHYRLRPEAKEAIEEVDVLIDTINQHSLTELLKPGTRIEKGELVLNDE
ncbi:hypothetical protein [Natronoglomus mannanivorans]|uniref:Uncharacterized protein n=1 Tax=Natronoglomus mannanivorans TaxID=2979990 RepID=A0AAP2YX47_9EURY|nr:hypothetical protein [Halobacteria archaeon AArc-xg1-1]